VPPSLVQAFAEVQGRIASPPGAHEQDALADFLDSHEYAAHVRNARALFAGRLELIKRACRGSFDSMAMSEPLGGLHAVLQPREAGFDEAQICDAAIRTGLPVRALSSFYIGPRAAQGLVLGFGSIPERSIAPMIGELHRLIG